MQLIGGGGERREPKNLLVMLNLPWQGFGRKNYKIEAHTGMVEWLVRYLDIEEALQTEIKETPEQKNQSYVYWCALSKNRKTITRLNLPLQLIWADRRDHLICRQVGYMTPLAIMPSSLVG